MPVTDYLVQIESVLKADDVRFLAVGRASWGLPGERRKT